MSPTGRGVWRGDFPVAHGSSPTGPGPVKSCEKKKEWGFSYPHSLGGTESPPSYSPNSGPTGAQRRQRRRRGGQECPPSEGAPCFLRKKKKKKGPVSGAPYSFTVLSFWSPARETRRLSTHRRRAGAHKGRPYWLREARSVFRIHRTDSLRGAGTGYPDCFQHFRMNRPPILVEVDRSGLNPESLKPDVGS